MDWRELVQLGLGVAQLADAHHLSELSIAQEYLVHLLNLLLEHEILCVPQNLLTVRTDYLLPQPFVQSILHPLAAALIETLEVAPIHLDAFPVHAPIAEIVLYLTRDVLPASDLLCLLLPLA